MLKVPGLEPSDDLGRLAVTVGATGAWSSALTSVDFPMLTRPAKATRSGL